VSARRLAPLAAVLCALPLAGCESTQDTSAKLAKQADRAINQKGVKVSKVTATISASRRTVLQDANGAATAVLLRNRTRRDLRWPAVSIDVRGRGGKTIFRNDEPGLEESLTGPSILRPREAIWWVHDQVFAQDAKARNVAVRVGPARRRAPRELPRIRVTRPKLAGDPVSGIAAEGYVYNRSKLLQRQLVLYAVALEGRRVVAAGRGQIKRLRPGRRAAYQIFFIGNPRGARVQIAAPPTTFK